MESSTANASPRTSLAFPCMLGGAFIIGILVRGALCLESWINPDEGIYILAASKSSLTGILQAAVPHAHPPLFYLLIALVKLFGVEAPQHLRFLSVAAWIVTSGVVVSSAFLIKSRLAALSLSTILLLAPSASVLSTVVRPYAMNNCTLALGIIGWWGWARTHDKRLLTLSQVGFSLSVLSHYGGVLVWGAAVVTTGLATLIARMAREDFRVWFRAQLPIALALLLAVTSNLSFAIRNPTLDNFVAAEWRELFPHSLEELSTSLVGAFDYTFFPGAGGVALIFCLGLALVNVFSERSSAFVSGSLVLVVLVSHMLLSTAGLYPFGATRHMYHLLPVVVPLLLEAFDIAGRSRLRGLGVAGAAAVSLFALPFGSRQESIGLLSVEHAVNRTCVFAALERVNGAIDAGQRVLMDGQTMQSLRPYAIRRGEISGLGRLGDVFKEPKQVTVSPRYCFHEPVEREADGLILSLDWCRRGMALPAATPTLACGVSLVP